jgi:hypothetical protein
MNYQVKLFGLGSKLYIVSLTDEQYKYLKKKKVENLEISEICSFLNIDLNSNQILQDPYWADHSIVVYENEIELWHSDFDIETQIHNEWIEKNTEYKYQLIIEQLCKGEFSSFTLEINDTFNPEKLSRITEEYGNFKDFVVGIKYDDKDITPTKVKKEVESIYYKFELIKK